MDDEKNGLEVSLDRFEEAAHTSAAEIAVRTTVSLIPYAGGAIIELWNGLAQRRVQDRVNAVFEGMKERLESVDAEKVDGTFFETEEFQTLIYLILERLHTSHNKKKLEMFGDALANSGLIEFRADDKEMYIRVLRDLSVRDLEILNDGQLKNWFPHMHEIKYPPEVLSSLSRLSGSGLVFETLHVKDPSPSVGTISPTEAARQLADVMKSPPIRSFHLSLFGERFLAFIASGRIDADSRTACAANRQSTQSAPSSQNP